MTRVNYCQFCGKVRYPTYWSAYSILQRMLLNSHHNKGSCYRCVSCHDWHITHYSEEERNKYNSTLLLNSQSPTKKICRSRRKKEKWRSLLKTTQIIDMKKIIPICPNTNLRTLAIKLSQAFGFTKLAVAAYYGCTVTLMEQAAYDLRQSGLCRQKVKQLLKNAEAALHRYEQRLLHPSGDDLHLFQPEEFNKEFSSQFKEDITAQEYFDLWKAVGFQAYAKYGNHMLALNHKYERFLQRVGCKEHTAIAMCMTVGQMLRLCSDAFTLALADAKHSVPPTNIELSVLFEPLNPRPVEQAWQMLTTELLRSIPNLTDDEMHDLKLAVDSIQQYLCDPYIIKELEIETIADYREIFSSRAQQCDAIAEHRRIQQRIKEQMLLDINSKRNTNQ